MVLKVAVPTSQRGKYWTGMTTEMLQTVELPPAKGIWAQNHDRLLKVTCQLEQTGVFTPEEENEITEMEQSNVKIGKQGVILDDTGNQELNEVFNNLTTGRSLERVISDEDIKSWTETSPQPSRPASPEESETSPAYRLDDQSVTTTAVPYFEESLPPCTAKDLPANLRKKNHFNGRPFADWGNLFAPLKASVILPSPPLTQRLWWQIATDQISADTNTVGTQSVAFDNKIKSFMTSSFSSQVWNEEVRNKVTACRTSCMGPDEIAQVRKDRQEGYQIKFPKSTAAFDTKIFTRKAPRNIDFRNFNQSRHQNYGARSINNSDFYK